MDRVYIVAIIGGLFGGLVTSLRLIVPVVAKLFYWIILHQRQRRANIHNRQPDSHEEMFHLSFLPTTFNTDWLLEYGDESDGYLIRSVPRVFTNSTCNCMISGACQEPLRIGPPGLFLPGLVVGCLPYDGLRMSTLECFFSSSCISTILTYLEYYTQMDGSPPINFIPPTVLPINISPLDNSTPSRFPKNTSIGTLLDEYFLEEWKYNVSYEDYFAACAPTHCNFEYVTRNNLLYVATSVLGLYGGLTIGLRFITWNAMWLYRWMTKRIRSHRVTIQS
ncbi:unnamed protein product [Rotaria sordida]|uniref:Uncharacterized protein n=2 Tax=Rotaria sordida TaxID=392033 RepID=A0A814DLG9_9BILA|nr:unnamed protein product [Rotaria sordida]CAF1047975.1 unnamed protein product [Rotaria sordida]